VFIEPPGELTKFTSELVSGRPEIQTLQTLQCGSNGDCACWFELHAASCRAGPPFYAFDLLAVDGYDTRQLPLRDRRKLLLGGLDKSAVLMF
jgi:hypothetical protein